MTGVTGMMGVMGAEWGDTGGDGGGVTGRGGFGVSPAGRSSGRSRTAPRPSFRPPVLIGHRPLIMLIQRPWAGPSG